MSLTISKRLTSLTVSEVLAVRRQPNIERWMAKTAVHLARTLPASSEAELTGLVLRELDDISTPARETGIRLRALVSGSEAISGPLTPDEVACVGAWEELVEREGIELLEAESRIAHPELGYRGRCDLVVRRAGHLESERVVVEVKTGRRVPDDVALQLAAYARATNRRDDEGCLCGPWPPVTGAAVVHLRPEKAEWLFVLLSEVEWRAFCGALSLARWQLGVDGMGGEC